MNEGGLVVRGKSSLLLVEELDGPELAAFQCGQRCGEPSPKRTIATRAGKWRLESEFLPAITEPPL
jgi:hypothetical protein